MPEAVKIFLIILFIIGLVGIALSITVMRMRKACAFIIDDLKRKKAFDPASAVDLAYTKTRLLHFGLRDYRPRAMGFLMKRGMVGVQENGRYYLCEDQNPSGADKGNLHPEG